VQQFERVPHIGRGEQVDMLAFLDAFAQQPGGAERGGDIDPGRLAVAIPDRGHCLAQAAGSQNAQFLRTSQIDAQ
jgi:hypothetical protein